MIIVRSPLRITLGCGGTDRPPYCQEHGGLSITAAIDKYVYVTAMKPFDKGIYLKYSKLERAESVDEVQHTIIREALRLMGVEPQIELVTLADIPAGTGLGSSSSLTTATLMALAAMQHKALTPVELAEMACTIEIGKLKAPIGKQDQYAAAFGGIQFLEFKPDGQVESLPIKLAPETIVDLEENLMLFFTGYSRNTNEVLNATMNQKFLDAAKDYTAEMIKALQKGDTHGWAIMIGHYWHEKSKLASKTSIDDWYSVGISSGAVGGKLVGAGGGGFLMFYAEDKRRLRRAMAECGLPEVRFRFDWEGTKVIVQ